MSELFRRPDPRTRLGLIDAIRGFAVLNMIVYHLCYDLFVVYSLDTGFWLRPPVIIWERFICFTFFIISGASLNFSRHGYRRGLIVSLGGFLITAVTLILIPSEMIWFGVLNCLGFCIIITFALRRALAKIPPLAGAGASMLMFALLYGLPEGYLGFFGAPMVRLPEALYGCRYLAFLGLPSKTFFSADYFPVFPWLFLFIFGFFMWRYISSKGWDGFFRVRVPVLGFIGRYSFIIYLLHQPLLLGICFLIFGHF